MYIRSHSMGTYLKRKIRIILVSFSFRSSINAELVDFHSQQLNSFLLAPSLLRQENTSIRILSFSNPLRIYGSFCCVLYCASTMSSLFPFNLGYHYTNRSNIVVLFCQFVCTMVSRILIIIATLKHNFRVPCTYK